VCLSASAFLRFFLFVLKCAPFGYPFVVVLGGRISIAFRCLFFSSVAVCADFCVTGVFLCVFFSLVCVAFLLGVFLRVPCGESLVLASPPPGGLVWVLVRLVWPSPSNSFALLWVWGVLWGFFFPAVLVVCLFCSFPHFNFALSHRPHPFVKPPDQTPFWFLFPRCLFPLPHSLVFLVLVWVCCDFLFFWCVLCARFMG